MPDILKSKKFQVFVLGCMMVFLTQVVGLEAAEAESVRDTLVKMVGAYLVGQGVADHGKEKEKESKKAPLTSEQKMMSEHREISQK